MSKNALKMSNFCNIKISIIYKLEMSKFYNRKISKFCKLKMSTNIFDYSKIDKIMNKNNLNF